MMTLALAHQLIPNSKLFADASTIFTRVHTDTRSLQAGDLFVALRGETFDGHTYLNQAMGSGAKAALIDERHALKLSAHGLLPHPALGLLVVANTKTALGVLAKNWRQHLAASKPIPVIAVTGSNGKTTLTQMIASILKAWQGAAALATAGNFNNDIGVPLTLLRLNESHHCAVVELGMNHMGEIADLAAMTAATVAVVNNAQREHQEFMGTVEAVAHENGAVISSLGLDGIAVFPADDAYAYVWRELAGNRKTLTFAFENADITASFVWRDGAWQIAAATPLGELTYALHMAGKHNVKNSLAAVACAIAAGVPQSHIQSGLSDFKAVAGRSRTTQLTLAGQAVTLVDDTYNANPDSVIAAIDMLMDLPEPRLLILGDMGEVGDQGPAFHAEVGAYAKARGVDAFWTLGDLCAHAAGTHFQDMDSLLSDVSALVVSAPKSILIKGSRFMKMERVVKHIEGLAHVA